MIFFYLVAALAALTTFAFSIFPGTDFLPLPATVYTAFGTVSGWSSWMFGIFGTTIRTAFLQAAGTLITIKVAFMLWDIVRFFHFPIIEKYLHND